MIEWVLFCCQLPSVLGDMAGCEDPRTLSTGFEKVSVIFVSGLIVLPGEGLAIALASAPAGNQETAAGVGRSQVRAAPATAIVPAAALSGTAIDAAGAGSL